jgi:hypothetical protein
MRYLPFVLLLGLACAKAPESRTDRTPAADCDAAVHGIENGSLAVAGHAVTYTGSGAITLARTGACRQLALALTGADGAPPVRMEFLRSYGIVRLDLPARLERVDEADTTFADPLATAAYVVHGRAGGYFLDVHVVQPALALARTAAGNITLELAPGGGAVPTAAPRARNVVVLEPRQGSATYPLTIRGYARTFEANVQAWITSGDSTYAKTFTTAADWSTTWGEFEITIPRGPSGDVQLFVGEESAKDGTPIGVTIPLRMP